MGLITSEDDRQSVYDDRSDDSWETGTGHPQPSETPDVWPGMIRLGEADGDEGRSSFWLDRVMEEEARKGDLLHQLAELDREEPLPELPVPTPLVPDTCLGQGILAQIPPCSQAALTFPAHVEEESWRLQGGGPGEFLLTQWDLHKSNAVRCQLLLVPSRLPHFSVEFSPSASDRGFICQLVAYPREYKGNRDQFLETDWKHDFGTIKASDKYQKVHVGNPVSLQLSQAFVLSGKEKYVQPSSHPEYKIIVSVQAQEPEVAHRSVEIVVDLQCKLEAELSAWGLRNSGGTCSLEAFGQIVKTKGESPFLADRRVHLLKHGVLRKSGLHASRQESFGMRFIQIMTTGAVHETRGQSIHRAVRMGFGGQAANFAYHYSGEARLTVTGKAEVRYVPE